MLLEGLHLPLTTPFFPDGRLNLCKLEANVAHYSLTPAAGLCVLGESSEAGLLSEEESVQVLKAVASAASSSKVLLAGIPRDSVYGALSLIEAAAALGYDIAVLRPPVSSGLTAQEHRLYLNAIADRSALPLLLSGSIPLEELPELAHHPQILGKAHDCGRQGDLRWLLSKTADVKRNVTVTQIFAAVTGRMLSQQKELPPDLLSIASLTGESATTVVSSVQTPKFKIRTKIVGFQVLASRTESLLDALAGGAVGAMLPLAAAAPQSCYEVLAAWKDGDQPLAAEKQLRLNQAALRMEGELGAAALKFACDLNGYAGGTPRLPLLPLTRSLQDEAAGLMSDLRA